MTNPFLQQPTAQPAAAPNPFGPGAQPAPQYTQQPAAAPVNPYAQQPAAAPAPTPTVPQPTAAIPVAVAGGFLRPSAPLPPPSGNIPPVAALNGRLLLILPERIDRGVPSKFTDERTGQIKTQDRITATVIVLDGGTLQWGGSPTEAPSTAQIPHVIKGMWIVQRNLISQLDAALQLRLQGGPGLALARLWKTGTAQNSEYVLADPTPQDAAVYDAFVQLGNPFAL